jgi:hypothetical protein
MKNPKKKNPDNLRQADIRHLTEEIVAVEPPIDSVKVAISTFFGGIVAYLVWILIHKLFSALGMAEVAALAIAQAEAFTAGDALAAGIAAGSGGYAASEVYKRLHRPLGIDSDPPPDPD